MSAGSDPAVAAAHVRFVPKADKRAPQQAAIIRPPRQRAI